MIETPSKLGNALAILLKVSNTIWSRATLQMLAHNFLDFDVARGELLSPCSTITDWQRTYEAMVSALYHPSLSLALSSESNKKPRNFA